MAEKGAFHGLAIGVPSAVLAGAVALSLLGYGAANAIETRFGIPAELTYGSPLDLLHLSRHALTGWMEMADKLHETENFRWLVYAMAGVGLALTLIAIAARTPKVRHHAVKAGGRAWRALSNLPGAGALRWLRRQALSFTPLAIGAAVPWLLIILMKMAITVFVILPYAGYKGALLHFDTWVVSAEFCSPIRGRNERLNPFNLNASPSRQEYKTKITPCLSLWQDGALVAEGRHVASTDSTVILFDPVSGNVEIEPTEGRSMRLSGPSAAVLNDQLQAPLTDD